jgi:hypothetical protein
MLRAAAYAAEEASSARMSGRRCLALDTGGHPLYGDTNPVYVVYRDGW